MIISDTSPLHYLELIDATDILPRLFGMVSIPDAVFRELNHPATPPDVREWMSGNPAWLIRKACPLPLQGMDLGAGETEAIALALTQPERSVLLDDRKAARVARVAGLTVTGTLGILLLAAERRILHPRTALERLSQTSFRATPELLALALEQGEALWQNSGPAE